MGNRSGDDQTEPSLELPSLKLPGLGRRRRKSEGGTEGTSDAGSAEPTRQLPTPEPAPAPVATAEPEPSTEPTTGPTTGPTTAPAPEPRRRATRSMELPRVSGWVAAAVTGLVVAVVGGAATYGGLAACEAVRGVSTCGGGPGLLVLVAILAVMILLGAALLRVLGVRDPGGTSFLAVGIVAVAVMLFLLDVVLSPWMFVVIPALTAAAFLLAHWVTTRFDESATGRRDWR